MEILKGFARAMDRQIDRRRMMEEADKLTTFEDRKAWIIANREKLLATFPPVPQAAYDDWDIGPSGYEGVNNGDFNA